MAAKNYKGEESEQSKARRKAKSDASEHKTGSAQKAGKQISQHQAKTKARIDEMLGTQLSPSRQNNPPQTGPGSQSNDED